MSLSEVQYLLEKHSIRPSRRKGQHFLVSNTILDQIVKAVRVMKNDAVIEIGPGIGNLTSRLVTAAKKVTAVELDERTFKKLLDTLAGVNSNLTVLYRDILSVNYREFISLGSIEEDNDYLVVGNIPYYLTSRLIRHLLSFPVMPREIVLLIQKEVARRIVAHAGKHSKLSLGVQFYGEPEIVLSVPRKHFYPEPEVDSALIRISNLKKWSYPESEELVWRLIAFGFAAKRKKLLHNISSGLRIPKQQMAEYFHSAGLDENIRAQGLSKLQWRGLAQALTVDYSAKK